MPNIFLLDGKFYPETSPLLQTLDLSRVKGPGVFETMRAYHGHIFLMQLHLRRLTRGLEQLQLKRENSPARLGRLINQTLQANRLKNARIRIMVWKESSRMNVAVLARAYHPYPAEKYRTGMRAIPYPVLPEHGFNFSGLKSVCYAPFLKAAKKAAARGFDEALLFSPLGGIIEGSRSNIFIIKDKTLLTPPLENGCLNGITRQTVMGMARKMNIKCLQCRITIPEVISANEAFLTNSLIEVMPLTSIGRHPVAEGKPGPLSRAFGRGYRSLVKKALNSDKNR